MSTRRCFHDLEPCNCATEEDSMRCDTCGRDVPEIKRMVVAPGYDKTLAKPVYNCSECYEKKEKAKKYNAPQGGKDN